MEKQNTVIQNLIEKLEARKEEYNPSYAYTQDDSNHYQSMQRAYEHAISLLRESLPEEENAHQKTAEHFWYKGIKRGRGNQETKFAFSTYFNQIYKAYNQ